VNDVIQLLSILTIPLNAYSFLKQIKIEIQPEELKLV
jgi:hypothetical protein